jgi:hypothetical protein
MKDIFIFIFGLITTIMAVGPLVIAGITEQRTKKIP